MQSSLLLEYMRTGTVSPLNKADTKREVEVKLGTPEDWAGRRRSIGWTGPLIADFHDSWAWHYGSLCVEFPHPSLYGLPGIVLSYGMMGVPIRFPPPFEELPQKRFTLGELIELLQVNDIQFNDNRGDRPDQKPVIVSEGAVCVATLHCKRSPDAEVIYLYPQPVFVLTHHPRAPLVMEGGTTFHFVTDGIRAALERAREAADGKDVRIGGGAATIRQYLRERLIGELHIAIAPVLLGAGER